MSIIVAVLLIFLSIGASRGYLVLAKRVRPIGKYELGVIAGSVPCFVAALILTVLWYGSHSAPPITYASRQAQPLKQDHAAEPSAGQCFYYDAFREIVCMPRQGQPQRWSGDTPPFIGDTNDCERGSCVILPSESPPPAPAPQPSRPPREWETQAAPEGEAHSRPHLKPRDITLNAERPPTLDQLLERLPFGTAAFNTPDATRVGKMFTVQAVLKTGEIPPEVIKSIITEEGQVTTAHLRVSDRMTATLTGGTAFDISAASPIEQMTSKNAPTEWDWQVTPKTVGVQTLILSFNALINIDGKDGFRTVNTLRKHIKVDVAWPQTFSEWLAWIKDTVAGLQSIWVILAAAVVGGLGWIRHQKKPVSSGNDVT
jgi:hypothetical protein